MGVIPTRFARRIDTDTIGLYTEDLTKLLQLDKATANAITLMGDNVTNNALILKANSIDSYPSFEIYGGSNVVLDLLDTKTLVIRHVGSSLMSLGGDATDARIGTGDNRNIFMSPNGTGLVKFGTLTALSGESLSGYITIKDAGGTSRKLAVIS